MEAESGVTRSIIDELDFWHIEGDQRERESGVTRNIIDEIHSSHIQEDKWKEKVVLFEVSLINFILEISKEIK